MIDMRTPARLIRDLITKGLGKQSFYFQFDDLMTLKFTTDGYEFNITSDKERNFSRVFINGEVAFIPVAYDKNELLAILENYLEHLELFYNIEFVKTPYKTAYIFTKKTEE